VTDRRSSQAPAAEREVELKYAVGDEPGLRTLLESGTLAGFELGPWRIVELTDRYLDTADRALAAAGYGARLRRINRRTLLTVKKDISGRRRRADPTVNGATSPSRALTDRMELEAPAGPGLDPRRWPESAARSLIEASSRGAALRTLFEIDQRREERDVVQDGDVVATLSLDVATVRRFGREKGAFTILEIEAARELAGERHVVLDQLAALLDEVEALRPEPRTKKQLATQLVERSTGPRRTQRPPRQPGIAREDSLSEAGRKVLRMHMLRMLAAEPGVRAGRDPVHVHKMRVATRRMRAAWRTFNGAYRPRLARRYVDELRTVAAALGEVRDQDVQLERLAAYRAAEGSERGAALDVLAADWQRRRDVARTSLTDLLDSAVYDRFIADSLDFVETAGVGAVGSDRVADAAGGRIWRAYEVLRAHDALLPWADTAALHALRIDGKRFRYALEFFREVLDQGADRVIADVTRLQDHLGDLNDADISAQVTRAWLIESGAGLTAEERDAVGAYLKSNETQVAQLTRGFRPLWRVVSGRPFRRRLGAVVSAV
jgi:CHAD domain-containing protein